MGDHDDRARAAERPERAHHGGLGLAVEGAGRLVEHDHVGVVVERPRDADALTLAAAQARAPLAHARLVAIGQGGDEVVRTRKPGGAFQGRAVEGIGLDAQGDVLCHAAVDQEHVLRHVADPVLPGR